MGIHIIQRQIKLDIQLSISQREYEILNRKKIEMYITDVKIAVNYFIGNNTVLVQETFLQHYYHMYYCNCCTNVLSCNNTYTLI